jgi:hypothetical protein
VTPEASSPHRFGFGGLPPRFPLARAATAFASLVTRPPRRPSATAAGFLRDISTNRQRGVTKRLTVTVRRHWPVNVDADVLIAGAAQRLVFGHLLAEVVGCEAVNLASRALRLRQQASESLGVACKSGAELVGRELCEEASLLIHGLIIPNRLGYVKLAKC